MLDCTAMTEKQMVANDKMLAKKRAQYAAKRAAKGRLHNAHVGAWAWANMNRCILIYTP